MNTDKTPFSIKLIFWLSSFSFWAITAIFILAVIANLLLFVDGFDHYLPIKVSMPLPIDVNETGVFKMNEEDFNVKVVDAYGYLEFLDAPALINRITVRVVLVVLALAWFIVYRIKQFTSNIRYGVIFELENINKLKQVAYGLFALFICSRIYMQFMAQALNDKMEFSSITVGAKIYDTDGIFQVAILLWALAHIFMRGIEMKEEQELTI